MANLASQLMLFCLGADRYRYELTPGIVGYRLPCKRKPQQIVALPGMTELIAALLEQKRMLGALAGMLSVVAVPIPYSTAVVDAVPAVVVLVIRVE